ncbi:hypothetical protein AMS68_002920 [Peltaster fructicola]|uniref:RRM domain-containing protein n=1 Tax=Peltaster fructicola TaxID=286661 RepID=A0A6H0XRR6_9PEZI|nr:hypothetical protein AMS68_002920 [Peltaster fructicola]
MAATTTRTTKRKSTDSTEQMLKKLKVAKSADRPLPAKSALKKDLPIETDTAPAKTKKSSNNTAAVPAKTKKSSDHTAVASAKTKKSAKSTPAPPVASEPEPIETLEEKLVESDDEQENGAALTADQTEALLAGFSSSDEDDEDEGIPIDKLPKAPVDKTLALKAAEVAGELTTANEVDSESTPGVIYIGRLPHGFFEHQMRAYFSQFGKITHLRLARSRKTARSQHYAFIEFASAAVADIVAKTMDKYLMFNHILQVRRVPSEQVKETIWHGEGRRARAMPLNRIEGSRLKKGTTKEGWNNRVERENKRRQSKADKLKELGYEYEAPVAKSLGETKQIEAPAEAVDEPAETSEKAQPARVKNASNSGKKRTAAAATEGRNRKKTKAKA